MIFFPHDFADKDQKQIEPVVNKSSPEPASIVTVSGGGLSQQHSPVTVTAGDNSTSPQSDSVTSSIKGDRRNPNPRGKSTSSDYKLCQFWTLSWTTYTFQC